MNQFVTISVKCSECGKVKGEGNHWYIVRRVLGSYEQYRVYSFYRPEAENEFPVCGESCLNKLTSKILSEKKPCAV